MTFPPCNFRGHPGERGVGMLTEEDVSQITKALTAGLGMPPSAGQLEIAVRWAGLTLVRQSMLDGALRGDLSMSLQGDEPVFDLTAVERLRIETERREQERDKG